MRWVLPLIAMLLMGFTPAPLPKPEKAKEDLKKMQGEWMMTSGKDTLGYGELLPAVDPTKISGNCIVGFLSHKDKLNIVLHTKTTPRCIDIIGRGNSLTCFHGIYTIVGDTLTIQWGEKARPADFSKLQPGEMILVFKRKKQ